VSCTDVCVVVDYDGGNEFYSEAMRRARKPYKCCECHDPIAVGDLHHYASGKSDGYLFSERTCAACNEIRKTFCCNGWEFTTLWEAISDQLFPEWNPMVAIDCLAKLTTDAVCWVFAGIRIVQRAALGPWDTFMVAMAFCGTALFLVTCAAEVAKGDPT